MCHRRGPTKKKGVSKETYNKTTRTVLFKFRLKQTCPTTPVPTWKRRIRHQRGWGPRQSDRPAAASTKRPGQQGCEAPSPRRAGCSPQLHSHNPDWKLAMSLSAETQEHSVQAPLGEETGPAQHGRRTSQTPRPGSSPRGKGTHGKNLSVFSVKAKNTDQNRPAVAWDAGGQGGRAPVIWGDLQVYLTVQGKLFFLAPLKAGGSFQTRDGTWASVVKAVSPNH